jgi:hypothetical protein
MAQRKSAAVSMEEQLYAAAQDRARKLGLSTFSAYIVQLILRDLEERGELVMKERGTGYRAQTQSQSSKKP